MLDTRISALEEDLDEVETSDEEDEEEEKVVVLSLSTYSLHRLTVKLSKLRLVVRGMLMLFHSVHVCLFVSCLSVQMSTARESSDPGAPQTELSGQRPPSPFALSTLQTQPFTQTVTSN